MKVCYAYGRGEVYAVSLSIHVWGHSFSTYVKFSEKLRFLIP